MKPISQTVISMSMLPSLISNISPLTIMPMLIFKFLKLLLEQSQLLTNSRISLTSVKMETRVLLSKLRNTVRSTSWPSMSELTMQIKVEMVMMIVIIVQVELISSNQLKDSKLPRDIQVFTRFMPMLVKWSKNSTFYSLIL
jgi:hypothetical protein